VSAPPKGAVRFAGPLSALDPTARAALLGRGMTSTGSSVTQRVAEIIARVRRDGDAALRSLARELDGVSLDSLEVPRSAWEAALARIPAGARRALERAARNITRAHTSQRPSPVEVEVEPGVRVGRRPDPLSRVGVYAPGGRAVYPSSVLMGAVPAHVAGVGEVVLCTPPAREGAPSDWVLAAAAIARVDRVFALGGAGAVAAMAFGTASVPRVDRIVGPGNAYVAEAKRQVLGEVTIDSPAGPSEILVMADRSASAGLIARELLAQAEHDENACVVALVDSEALATAVLTELEALLADAPRREIAAQALDACGAVLSYVDAAEAWDFTSAFAPEHLLIATARPQEDLPRARNAGTVFLGASSSVAFGDYLTGANHVLPTGGRARFYSGLSLLDFYRWTAWQEVTPEAAARLAPDAIALAEVEGLFAHAEAARHAGGGKR
jgi:histidinol dehydrogenase